MFTPAGDLVITAGIILFSLLVSGFLYTIPLKISLAVSRDSSRLSGEADLGYGPVSVALFREIVTNGEIRIYGRRLFSIPVQTIGGEEKRETTGDDRSHDEKIMQGINHLPLFVTGVRQIVRHLRIDTFSCHARIGCGDPCTTGIIYGYIQAIIPLLPANTEIYIIPDFDMPALEGEVRLVTLIIYPFSLLVSLCRMITPKALKNLVFTGGKKDAETG